MAVYPVDHPLVRHKLGRVRRESAGTGEFRSIAGEPARPLRHEAAEESEAGTISVRESA